MSLFKKYFKLHRCDTFFFFETLWNQSKAKVITGGVRTWEKEEKKFFLSWKKPENYYRFQSEQFMAYESHKPRPTIYCDHENSWDLSHFSNIQTSWKLPDWNGQGFFILLWIYNINVRKMAQVPWIWKIMVNSRSWFVWFIGHKLCSLKTIISSWLFPGMYDFLKVLWIYKIQNNCRSFVRKFKKFDVRQIAFDLLRKRSFYKVNSHFYWEHGL